MWTSRGLRGSSFENIINMTNTAYRKKNLAIIQKTPTPITPVSFDSKSKTISLAYFEQKSTVDYIGVVQGIPVCFDAKEISAKSLPLQNIHEHQVEFMQDFVKQKGVAFFLVHFTFCDEYYFLPFDVLEDFWTNAKTGGRKSVPYNAFEKKYLIKYTNVLNYLEALNVFLSD